ncbi:hypothetical protein MMC31_004245, partial [Peltigera leucophlebia]|nr:hypothetical protein [Peltigera leucophlebia]
AKLKMLICFPLFAAFATLSFDLALGKCAAETGFMTLRYGPCYLATGNIAKGDMDLVGNQLAIDSLIQKLQAYKACIQTWSNSRINADIKVQSLKVPSKKNNALSTSTADPAITTTSTITATSTTLIGTLTSVVSIFKYKHLPINNSSNFPPSTTGSMKIAVYYGQRNTDKTTLGTICQNPNVDMVALAFLTHFFGPGGFPTINFGAACGGQTPQMTNAGATGLLSCIYMAADIKKCQGLGKKILLSVGGAREYSQTAIPDKLKAKSLAKQLWDLFGTGTGVDPGLRPFGNATIDGFDIGVSFLLFSVLKTFNGTNQHIQDNEDHSTTNYVTFVTSLRQIMSADTSNQYYISASPQCPIPDKSIPLEVMQAVDFVFVQWYNNPKCNAGTPAFLGNFKAWSTQLSKNGVGPRLYVGLPGCQNCASSGYLSGPALNLTLAEAMSANVSNLDGIILWDGPQALANVQEGKDYLTRLKEALSMP